MAGPTASQFQDNEQKKAALPSFGM